MNKESKPEFVIVKLTACTNKKVKHLWGKKLLGKRYLNHLYKKCSWKEKAVKLLGVEGIEAELPFVSEQAEEMDKEILKQYIDKLMEKYEVKSCYLDRELFFMKKTFGRTKEWIFKYILLEEGMEKFFSLHKLNKKDTKYVLADDGTQKIEMVLQFLLPDANYLTVVTDRPSFFNNAVDEVLEATGLLMQVSSWTSGEILDGNVVVLLNNSTTDVYNRIENNAYVIDLNFTDQKLEYVISRRKDLTILYDFEVNFNGEVIEKGLGAEVLISANWKLKRFAERPGISLTPEEMRNIAKKYGISVKSMKIIQPYKSILD